MTPQRHDMLKLHLDFPWDSRDRLIAGYPRSGSTWVRAVVSYILAKQAGDTDLEHLSRLARYTPDIYFGQAHLAPTPRIVKTHSDFAPPFRKLTAVYMVRDIRDVAPSYYRLQAAGQVVPSFSDALRDFILGDADRFAPWQEHVESWAIRAKKQTRRQITFVRFEDVRRDPIGGFRNILDFLHIGCSKQLLQQAIEASSLGRMKARPASEFAAICDTWARGSFFNAGQAGRYRHLLSDADHELIQERCGHLLQELGYTED